MRSGARHGSKVRGCQPAGAPDPVETRARILVRRRRSSSSVFCTACVAWGYQIATGMGSTGLRPPVMWGIFLVQFRLLDRPRPFGHPDLRHPLPLQGRFRTSINRMAEAMTMICILMAGSYPLIHLGRSWIFYWLIPYPNQRQLWPDFISPLIFDFLAVSTYFTVSLIFFYTGLVPDLAIIRDRTTGIAPQDLRVPRPRLDGFRTGSGTITPLPTSCLPASPRPWSSPSTPSSPGTSPFPYSRAGTARSSRPTSWPGQSIRVSPWCSPCSSP